MMTNWTDVEQLRESKLDELVNEVKDIQGEIDGLEETKKKVRGLIQDLVQPLLDGEGKPIPVDVAERRVRWVPDGTTESLSAQKLAAAGVTPDQIKAGTAVKPRKGYIEIRPIKEPSAVASMREHSTRVARAALDHKRRTVEFD
jgi:hypothetical protein